jgi:hypothetical protein
MSMMLTVCYAQVLNAENFPHSLTSRTEEVALKSPQSPMEDIETGVAVTETAIEDEQNCAQQKLNNNATDMTADDEDESISELGDEQHMIEIPKPGLYNADEDRGTRFASGACSICISSYQVGSDVVWSSNSLCEHVFHAECIESWLIKQREGSLCPCCRQEFIIDPLDRQSFVIEPFSMEFAPQTAEGLSSQQAQTGRLESSLVSPESIPEHSPGTS